MYNRFLGTLPLFLDFTRLFRGKFKLMFWNLVYETLLKIHWTDSVRRILLEKYWKYEVKTWLQYC